MIYEFSERICKDLPRRTIPVPYHQVPHGYSKTKENLEEFPEIMKENANKDLKQFLHKTTIGI